MPYYEVPSTRVPLVVSQPSDTDVKTLDARRKSSMPSNPPPMAPQLLQTQQLSPEQRGTLTRKTGQRIPYSQINRTII